MLGKLVRVTSHSGAGRIRLLRAFGGSPGDPYKILQVTRSATQKEIKDAFHQLTKKYHPDVNGGDTVKYKSVLDAYHILGNAEKRAAFDLEHTKKGGPAPNQSDFDPNCILKCILRSNWVSIVPFNLCDSLDPLLMYFRSKYSKTVKPEAEEPFVPPHMKGEKRKRTGEAEDSGEESKLVEYLLGVSLLLGLGAAIHRYQQLKNIPKVYPEDEDRAQLEADLKDPKRLVRLSELDCKTLTLDELELLDRYPELPAQRTDSGANVETQELKMAHTCINPNSQLRVKEYREVYKIPSLCGGMERVGVVGTEPSPDSEIEDAVTEFQRRLAAQRELRTEGGLQRQQSGEQDFLSGFDYNKKFNSTELSK